MGSADSADETTKELPNFDCAYTHKKGKRPTQEDRHLAASFTIDHQKVRIYAIFDGHSGDLVSEYLKKNMKDALKNAMRGFDAERLGRKEPVKNAIRSAFENLQQEAIAIKGGSTAIVAIRIENKFYIANVGDSSGIRIRQGSDKPTTLLSMAASAKDPHYADQLLRRGGEIEDGRVKKKGGSLAMTRAFGDKKFIGVVAEPEIIVSRAKPGDLFLLACDGLTLTPDEITYFVGTHRGRATLAELSKGLVRKAFAADSTDNISVLLISI
jgi:serine/threonine protein phosphatase PrpC